MSLELVTQLRFNFRITAWLLPARRRKRLLLRLPSCSRTSETGAGRRPWWSGCATTPVLTRLLTSGLTFAVKIFTGPPLAYGLFLAALHQLTLSKSAAEVVFLCQNDQLAWAHDSKCNGNCLLFSSDYENAQRRARDDTSPAGTLTTACRLHVLANQVHSFIMNLQLLSKRQHYSHILPARCSFSGRFCHLSAELCGCQSVTALYLDGSGGTSYQVKPGERCRLMRHGSRWQLHCGNSEQVLENFPLCRWVLRGFFPRKDAHICSTFGCNSRIIHSRIIQFSQENVEVLSRCSHTDRLKIGNKIWFKDIRIKPFV